MLVGTTKTKLFDTLLITLLQLTLTCGLTHANEKNTPPNTILKDYISKDDGVFAFSPVSAIPLPGATANILMLRSQQWRTSSDVDKTIWEHGLVVVTPDQVVTDKSFLFIWSGDNDENILDIDQSLLAIVTQFALQTGSIVSVVRQVPNQPLIFTSDPGNLRDEDALVAYTFDQAMRTGDLSWPAYLPMVKSAVRAMDAIELFVEQNSAGEQSVNGFVVSGFSKRGATAWLTAAVDDRVIAVAPGVFDVLNFAPSIENHRRSYGEFSSALKDYVKLEILDRLRTVEGKSLLKVVDPYTYRKSLDMPKYILNASGDQFYTPDSSTYYIDDLPGETTLRYLQNTDHGGSNNGFELALEGLLGWYQRILAGLPAPQITWEQNENKQLIVSTNIKPTAAVLWQASIESGRDFRFEKVGPIWQPTLLQEDIPKQYVIDIEDAPNGAKAYFVEMVYEDAINKRKETYSTQIIITPEKRPFNLLQSLNEPQSSHFWAKEFKAAVGESLNYKPVFDATTLKQFLPVKIFDNVISSIESGAAVLSDYSSAQSLSLRECFATRMNIESKKIDWYSTASLWTDTRFVWKGWNKAHTAYQHGAPWKAAGKCWWMNH